MKKYKIQFLIIFIVGAMVGCESFVEVEIPNSQLTGANVFEEKNTANAALVDVYAKLRDTGLLTGTGLGVGAGLGLYADELIYYGFSDENISYILYTNNLLSTTGFVNQKWRESYHQIYCANAVITGCENSTALEIEDKNQFMGEAIFVRALIHFYLMNVYGDIPYVKTTNYEINRSLSRMPTAEVFNQIIGDLEQAITLLPEAYINPERVRPNRSVAQALLARVYLYKGDWAAAANAASAVVNNSMYIWETDSNKLFLKDCTATIWQFSPKLPGDNTYEGATFIFQTGPPPSMGLSPALYNSFAATDLRKTNWIKEVTNGTSTWYHANKYKQQSNTGTSMEYSIVFRLTEQYLIRAEARARQGELINAREDLNKVRQLAGLPDTTAITGDELVAAILQERKFELFTEFGHRFFDLKRTGSLDSVLATVKPGWNSTDQLWPIAETELLANPNLIQNPGY